jgi:hypothetical protein
MLSGQQKQSTLVISVTIENSDFVLLLRYLMPSKPPDMFSGGFWSLWRERHHLCLTGVFSNTFEEFFRLLPYLSFKSFKNKIGVLMLQINSFYPV